MSVIDSFSNSVICSILLQVFWPDQKFWTQIKNIFLQPNFAIIHVKYVWYSPKSFGLAWSEFRLYKGGPLDCSYRTRATITRSWSVTALLYKPQILGLKNEEFPFLVHKLSVI